MQLKYKVGSSCHLSNYLIQNLLVHLRSYPFIVQFRAINWFTLFAYCFPTTFFTVSTSCGLVRSSPVTCGWLHPAIRGRMLWEQLQVSLLTDVLNPFLFIYFYGFVQNGLPFSGLPVFCSLLPNNVLRLFQLNCE